MQNGEKKFLQIFKSGKYLDMLELSDANLQTDDGCNFDIHRVTLATSSDYFSRMFLGMDKKRRKFHIRGISGECLSDILCYAYTGHVRVTERNVADLIMGADYLLMDDLLTKIKDNMEENLTEVNCLRIVHAAYQISDEDMFRKSFRFIQMRFERIMRCRKDDLADLPLDILVRILSNRSLRVYDETTVWQAIVAWTQKDVQLRMSYVPQLLLTLASKDVGEELASEILQHEIISANNCMKDLAEIPSSNDSASTSLDVILTFLRSYTNRFTEPVLRHRIPLQLFVAWYSDGDENNLYVSYDENTDLWRKLTEVSQIPHHLDVLIAIGHNLYILNMATRTCMNFDFSAMAWVRMTNFKNRYSSEFRIVATDAYIYAFDEPSRFGACDVEVYDIARNRWRKSVPLHDVYHIVAAAIDEKIYVLGNNESSDAMVMQTFDEDAQQWSSLPPPAAFHPEFSLVAYRQKIYLIGGSKSEVFDPETNLWKKLPGALRKYSSPKAMAVGDKIVVCDATREYREYWTNAEECWVKLEPDTFKGLSLTDSWYCTVDDVETIKMITRQNRDPETRLGNIRFY